MVAPLEELTVTAVEMLIEVPAAVGKILNPLVWERGIEHLLYPGQVIGGRGYAEPEIVTLAIFIQTVVQGVEGH
jgi:hypothetical protein